MGDRTVRIRVSAAKDRDFDRVFRSIEETAKRAQRVLSGSAEKAGSDLGKSTKKGASEAEKAIRLLEREFKDELPKSMDAGVKAATEFGKKASASFAATRAEFNAMARDVEKSLDKMSRAQRGFGEASKRGMGGGISGKAVAGGLGRAGRAALGISKDIAMGAGLDLSLQNAISRSVGLESRAVALSNAGYMPGQAGANGQRVSRSALMGQARDIGNATAFDPEKVLEGLQKFVAKTGDLQTGRDSLKDMAVLAKATGAELDDMVDAAGDVANALGDTDNKGEKVRAVMGAIAAQGKEGAVEIKDLAVQMAKLGASAGMFEGDASRVIASMGALAQMTRAKGGAASSTQAATSVTSFTNTFSKGARLDAFKRFGVNVHGAGGAVRDPKELIIDAMRAASSASHGGMAAFDRNMGDMFKDVRARSVTRGFETVYRDAGGGEAGAQAVRAAFERLEKATMDNVEIQESFRRAMETSESKAQLMNNQFAEIGGQLADAFLPALFAITPEIVELGRVISDVTGGSQKVRDERARDVTESVTERDRATLDVLDKARNGGRGLEIPADTFVKADEESASLDKVIADQRLAVDKARRTVNTRAGGTAPGADGAGRFKTMDASERATIERMHGAEAQLRALEAMRDEFKNHNARLYDLFKDGIVTKPRYEPTPKAGHKGTNGPEH